MAPTTKDFQFPQQSSPSMMRADLDSNQINQRFLHYLLAYSRGGSPVQMAEPAEKISVGRAMRKKNSPP